MTRDDLKWTGMALVAVLVGLAALSDTTVQMLGLPAAIVPWLPWCRLGALMVGVVGAKLGNSPLPGKADPPLSSKTLDNIAKSIPAIFLLAVLTMPGCLYSAPPNLTPQAQKAYTADQVVTRLGELQNAVIDAATANKVKTADARLIVAWISGDKTTTPPTVGVLDMIAATPSGWQAAAQVAWPRIQAALQNNPNLSVWAPIVQQLLGAQ